MNVFYWFVSSDGLRLRYCTVGHVRRVRPAGGGRGLHVRIMFVAATDVRRSFTELVRRAHENIINAIGSAAFRVCNLASRGSRSRPTGASVRAGAPSPRCRVSDEFFETLLVSDVQSAFSYVFVRPTRIPPRIERAGSSRAHENSVVCRYVFVSGNETRRTDCVDSAATVRHERSRLQGGR